MAMISLNQYLLESSICLLSFYAFYHFILRRETFFQLNRFYLLLTPLCSFLIPLLNIEIYKSTIPTPLEVFFPIVVGAKSVNYQLLKQIEESGAFFLSFTQILFIIYLLGVMWMMIRLIRKFWLLIRMIQRGEWYPNQEFTFVHTCEDRPIASFFKYIIGNKSKLKNMPVFVLEHELVHIRQKHSIDLLVMEVWTILKWFNPLIYLFRRSLRLTHEFIADESATRRLPSVHSYASYLVRESKQQYFNRFMVSPFASFTKDRLTMMTKNKGSKVRFLLSIPLLAGLLTLFSFDMIHPVEAGQLRFNFLIDMVNENSQKMDTKIKILKIKEKSFSGVSRISLSEWRGLLSSSLIIQLRDREYTANNFDIYIDSGHQMLPVDMLYSNISDLNNLLIYNLPNGTNIILNRLRFDQKTTTAKSLNHLELQFQIVN